MLGAMHDVNFNNRIRSAIRIGATGRLCSGVEVGKIMPPCRVRIRAGWCLVWCSAGHTRQDRITDEEMDLP